MNNFKCSTKPAMEDKKHILLAIVDDDEESALVLGEFMESRDISVECFTNAESFMKSNPCRFTAILLDINLPGMWGSECGYKLRGLGYEGPIIAISGNLESWNPDDLHEVGFTCGLEKPLDTKKLLDLLCQHTFKK